MQSKPKKLSHQSIRFKILVPTLIIVLCQTLFFVLALVSGGIFKHVDNNAYETLSERTRTRKNYLQSSMLEWAVTDSVAEEFNAIVKGILDKNSMSIASLDKEKKLSNEILSETFDPLTALLRKNSVNDAFLILETGQLYGAQKACTHIRDYDTYTSPENDNNDLFLINGLSSLSKERQLSLNRNWQVRMNIDEADDFYYKPLTHAGESKGISSNAGVWTITESIDGTNSPTITYSVPLMLNGKAYGVLGIGVLKDTFLKSLPSEEILEDNKGAYILAKTEDGGNTFYSHWYSGSFFVELLGNHTELIPRGKELHSGTWRFQGYYDNAMDILGNIQYLKLYKSNTPFLQEQWALISITRESDLLTLSQTMHRLLLVAAMLSLAIGLIIVIFTSYLVTKPITGLSKQLENSKSQELIHLSPTGITEIDRLSRAIEELNRDVSESASRMSKIIDSVNIGIGAFEYNKTTDLAFVSRSLFRLLGLSNQENTDKILSGKELHAITSFLSQYKLEESNLIFLIPDSMGSENTYIKMTLLEEQNKIIGVVEDISAEILEKKKIEYERDYDILTGLLNRRAYHHLIMEKFRHRKSIGIGAVLMIDIDNLKYINDTYGHDFGDEYIKAAANVLQKCDHQSILVSRPSGDEFNLFFSGYHSQEEILTIIEDLKNKLKESYVLLPDGTKYIVRVSGGIAWYPQDSILYDELAKYADFAMYSIKKSIKGTFAFFDRSQYQKDSFLLSGIAELNQLIENQKMRYCFQPIIDVRKASIYGYEALMRPQSEILKSPLDVLRIARTDAKLYQIELLTFRKSMEEFDSLIKKGIIPRESMLFINSIANYIIHDEDFDSISTQYASYFNQLVVEVLENDQIIEELFLEKRNAIKNLGGKIALDDFGTGYNSEYALLSIEPDIVKIDISIVNNIDSDKNRQNMLRGLMGYTTPRNIKVLAEGVETAAELKTLIEFGVDYVQGYYLGRPQFEPAPLSQAQRKEIKAIVSQCLKRQGSQDAPAIF